jgi:hypothetical protein
VLKGKKSIGIGKYLGEIDNIFLIAYLSLKDNLFFKQKQ